MFRFRYFAFLWNVSCARIDTLCTGINGIQYLIPYTLCCIPYCSIIKPVHSQTAYTLKYSEKCSFGSNIGRELVESWILSVWKVDFDKDRTSFFILNFSSRSMSSSLLAHIKRRLVNFFMASLMKSIKSWALGSLESWTWIC